MKIPYFKNVLFVAFLNLFKLYHYSPTKEAGLRKIQASKNFIFKGRKSSEVHCVQDAGSRLILVQNASNFQKCYPV